MAKQNKNDVVVIELDRPRILKFGHKALKTYQSLSDSKLEDIGSNGEFKFEDVEKLIYCGLLSDGRKHGDALNLEDMEDLLDEQPLSYTIEKMSQALANAFGGTEEVGKSGKK